MKDLDLLLKEISESVVPEIRDIIKNAYLQGYLHAIRTIRENIISYIDLGLPSGTKWAFYPRKLSYTDAVSQFKLPNGSQFAELTAYTTSRIEEIAGHKLYVFKSNINGNEVFFEMDKSAREHHIWEEEANTRFLRIGDSCWGISYAHDKSIPSVTAVIEAP